MDVPTRHLIQSGRLPREVCINQVILRRNISDLGENPVAGQDRKLDPAVDHKIGRDRKHFPVSGVIVGDALSVEKSLHPRKTPTDISIDFASWPALGQAAGIQVGIAQLRGKRTRRKELQADFNAFEREFPRILIFVRGKAARVRGQFNEVCSLRRKHRRLEQDISAKALIDSEFEIPEALGLEIGIGRWKEIELTNGRSPEGLARGQPKGCGVIQLENDPRLGASFPAELRILVGADSSRKNPSSSQDKLVINVSRDIVLVPTTLGAVIALTPEKPGIDSKSQIVRGRELHVHLRQGAVIMIARVPAVGEDVVAEVGVDHEREVERFPPPVQAEIDGAAFVSVPGNEVR